jgi:hypothetical protein
LTTASDIKAQLNNSTYKLSIYLLSGISNISYKFNDVLLNENEQDYEVLSSYYNFNNSRRNGSFGGGLGVNYLYNIDDQFAIVTGLEFSTYASKLSISEFSEEYPSTDDRGYDFTFKYFFEKYMEKQLNIMITIPLMVRYEIPLDTDFLNYFVSGGMKIGLPIVAKATITPGTVSTSGYYEYEGRTYTDLVEHGFINGKQGDQTKRNIKFGLAAMISLEAGARMPIFYRKDVVASVYFDYTPNNIQKLNDRHVLEYQSFVPSDLSYKSALNSAIVKKINLFSLGLKVGITF